jgi:hypothetical protein
MRLLTGIIVAAVGAAFGVTGCVSAACKPRVMNCPVLKFGDRTAGPADGNVAWSWRGKSGTLGLSSELLLRRMSCTARLTMGADVSTADASSHGATLSIDCATTDSTTTDFSVRICLGDPYAWTPGTLAIPPASNPSGQPCGSVASAEVMYTPACGSRAECGVCRAPAAVNVVVENVRGGSAPRPALVTSDYLRTFRVELAMPSPVIGADEGHPGACESGITLGGSVHFASTPADFLDEPWLVCPSPPCLG